ncbi:hypothetical protein BDR03DRAFT_974060 [Suillus americanus]|nr:hypothetical protein BDR03DRAFT_974060 [Suillus americanus]
MDQGLENSSRRLCLPVKRCNKGFHIYYALNPGWYLACGLQALATCGYIGSLLFRGLWYVSIAVDVIFGVTVLPNVMC